MYIVPLDPMSETHTHIVLSMVIHSELDYGELDSDARLVAWQKHQGVWGVAVNEQGSAMGIACVVHLSDTGDDALLWLEVLPTYRRLGVGQALLRWVYRQIPHPLVIHSTPSAAPFYEHIGVACC